MRRSRFFAYLSVAAVWPLLVACQAPMDDRAAIVMEDGTLNLNILLCAQEWVWEVSVAELSSSSPKTWSVKNPSNESRPGGEEWFSVSIFQPPDDWSVEADTLSEFEDGISYHLYTSTSNPPAFTMSFSLSDLRNLDEGEVLVATQRGALAMTREDFESGARDDCE